MNPDFLAAAGSVGPLGALPLKEGFSDDPEILGGDYLLLERLGEGGMGEVYRAIQLGTRREVAVKRMRTGRSDARFEQEVMALGRLRHPGIAGLIQAGTHDGRPFLVMEYVAGGSLADRLASGPLAPKEAARIVREAAEAIGHAHQAGIVHRDVKPGNLLLDADGRVRVTDFSVAKDLAAGQAMTLEGQALGTPAYMAPEQVDSRKGDIGPATDVHGLGATLFHALTGRAPFQGGNTAETVRLAASQEADWRADWQGIHRDLRTLCMRAMHPVTGRRYASAGELADDLGRFLDGKPIVARPVSGAERLARWMWRPWPLALVATLTASIIGAAVAQISSDRRQRTRIEALLADWPAPAPQSIRVHSLAAGSSGGVHAAFNGDGRVFAWGAAEGNIRIASVDPYRMIANSLKGKSSIQFHRFLPGTSRTNLFVANTDGTWRVWTAGSVRLVVVEGKAEGGVVAFDPSDDGRRFFVASASGDIVGWDLDKSRRRPVFQTKAGGRLIGAYRSPLPDQLLGVLDHGGLQCWDVRSDRLMWTRPTPGEVTASIISPDRTRIAAATVESPSTNQMAFYLRFYLTADGSEAGHVRLDNDVVRSMSFSPDGTRLLLIRERRTGRIIHPEGKILFDTMAHAGPLAGGEFSPDGLRLLTWDKAGVARLWDAHSGRMLTDSWTGPGGIAQATFSPDGWRIGSGDMRPTGTLWDGRCPLPPGWDRSALTAALLRDGGLAAVRRAVWLDPADPDLLRRLAEVTRRQSGVEWREAEAAFLERRAAMLEERRRR